LKICGTVDSQERTLAAPNWGPAKLCPPARRRDFEPFSHVPGIGPDRFARLSTASCLQLNVISDAMALALMTKSALALLSLVYFRLTASDQLERRVPLLVECPTTDFGGVTMRFIRSGPSELGCFKGAYQFSLSQVWRDTLV
jgi:hypothetical protein